MVLETSEAPDVRLTFTNTSQGQSKVVTFLAAGRPAAYNFRSRVHSWGDRKCRVPPAPLRGLRLMALLLGHGHLPLFRGQRGQGQVIVKARPCMNVFVQSEDDVCLWRVA